MASFFLHNLCQVNFAHFWRQKVLQVEFVCCNRKTCTLNAPTFFSPTTALLQQFWSNFFRFFCLALIDFSWHSTLCSTVLLPSLSYLLDFEGSIWAKHCTIILWEFTSSFVSIELLKAKKDSWSWLAMRGPNSRFSQYGGFSRASWERSINRRALALPTVTRTGELRALNPALHGIFLHLLSRVRFT